MFAGVVIGFPRICLSWCCRSRAIVFLEKRGFGDFIFHPDGFVLGDYVVDLMLIIAAAMARVVDVELATRCDDATMRHLAVVWKGHCRDQKQGHQPMRGQRGCDGGNKAFFTAHYRRNGPDPAAAGNAGNRNEMLIRLLHDLGISFGIFLVFFTAATHPSISICSSPQPGS